MTTVICPPQELPVEKVRQIVHDAGCEWPEVKLFQGDCLELMKQIPDGSVDLVLCDLPYGVVNRKSNGLRNLDKGAADVLTFDVESAITESLRVCSGSFYFFCGTEQVSAIRAQLVRCGLTTRLCVWEKTNPSPMNGQHAWLSGIECCVYAKKPGAVFNEHCQNSVWRYPTARGKLHPTMKPLSLMERLVLASSSVGDTVLDFVMGSGTTGVAAVRNGRSFIGMELDPGYFQIAQNRIQREAEERQAKGREGDSRRRNQQCVSAAHESATRPRQRPA